MPLPLLVIVGPTASGKTALAVRIAKQFNGEIISADSRAIYKGLDIGTAKPSMQERDGVSHWGIDLVTPGQRFTTVDFKKYATKKINEIRLRGRLPILVGGTGLYVDSVIYDFTFPKTNDRLKRFVDNMTLQELYKYCDEHNISLPENNKNKRYVINAILRDGQSQKRRTRPIDNTIVVGIATEKEILRERITARAEEIVADCTISEAQIVADKYGWDNEAMTGNIYPLIHHYLEGNLTMEELKSQFCVLDWRLAKRQLTWLRRNSDIWWGSNDEVYTYVARQLAKMNNS